MHGMQPELAGEGHGTRCIGYEPAEYLVFRFPPLLSTLTAPSPMAFFKNIDTDATSWSSGNSRCKSLAWYQVPA